MSQKIDLLTYELLQEHVDIRGVCNRMDISEEVANKLIQAYCLSWGDRELNMKRELYDYEHVMPEHDAIYVAQKLTKYFDSMVDLYGD